MSESLIIFSEDGFTTRLWVLNKLLEKKNQQQKTKSEKLGKGVLG